MATENPTTPVDGETREALYRTVNQFMELFNFALAIRALIRDIPDAGGSDSAAAAQSMCTQMAEAARKFSTEADEAWLASHGGEDYISGANAALAALREGTKTVFKFLPLEDVHSEKRYYMECDAAINGVLAAAGPMSNFTAGAMATLAEFIITETNVVTMDSLDEWMPDSTLPTAERKMKLREFAAETEGVAA